MIPLHKNRVVKPPKGLVYHFLKRNNRKKLYSKLLKKPRFYSCLWLCLCNQWVWASPVPADLPSAGFKTGDFNVHDYSFTTFLTHFRPSSSMTLTK